MKRSELEKLQKLQAIATMKRDLELAKLAVVAQSRTRLIQSLNGLSQSVGAIDGDETPGLIRARLAHLRWVEGRRRTLNQRLALVSADYLERRPAALKAFGRAQVLSELTAKEKARIKARS